MATHPAHTHAGEAAQGNWVTNSPAYQTLLVLLLSLNFGIVFFDRQALNALMPFVQPELELSQTEIGLLAGGLSFSWAIAAFFVGRLSDSLGKRKVLLVIATIAFSLCSFLSGLATSFLFLFAARLLMGAAEGGVMPISHAMVASEVNPERRGLAQGVAQNLGSNLLGSFAAPVVLVAFATAFSWREAFYLAALPGLVSAAMIWFMLREPEPAAETPAQVGEAGDHHSSIGFLEALKVRNMWICVVVGVLLVAHFVITWAFMPNFLVQTRGMDAFSMSWLVGSLGIAAALYSFLVAGISDRIGRKPVMVFLPFLSLIGPLGVIYLDPANFAGDGLLGLSGYATVLIPIFFIGWMVNGVFPIFMATIPSESFRPIHHATVLGLAMGSCEVLGGVLGPPVAGVLNDAFGPETFLYVLMVLAVIAGFVAMGLKETAPAALRAKGLEPEVA
ncbi:MFS transporter [Aurantiacibacter poecillastricola]|uniref:MFS transporter n=1 Tax=Aurantiacibacter poecillastricola TaxID=3064385 RepID=UPI00273E865A|nr:MFS transporter [Aurantiacibacter sp. 219JJ12-13]MDP5261189.1 MFS transporter [Aurantiacibacter sp. 219JJ12-13]